MSNQPRGRHPPTRDNLGGPPIGGLVLTGLSGVAHKQTPSQCHHPHQPWSPSWLPPRKLMAAIGLPADSQSNSQGVKRGQSPPDSPSHKSARSSSLTFDQMPVMNIPRALADDFSALRLELASRIQHREGDDPTTWSSKALLQRCTPTRLYRLIMNVKRLGCVYLGSLCSGSCICTVELFSLLKVLGVGEAEELFNCEIVVC